jgi:Ca-activated chloride channel homolog
MKGLTVLVLFVALLVDPAKIGKINGLKQEAKKAYLTGDYKTAITKYRYLVDSLHVQEDEVLLNLANAYFNTNDTTHAVGQYQTLTRSSKKPIRSKAQQHLGVLANRAGKTEEALTYFKEALKSDPSNEEARYNYELLKKKLEEQKKQEQEKKDQNKDQKNDQKQQEKQDQQKQDQQKKEENKDQQQKDQQQKNQEKQDQQKKEQEKQQQQQENKEQDKKDIPPSVAEKLQQMRMSEEKAKMILEAMKNQEIQYLQQNKRKATKPKDRSKPDW